MRTTWEQLHTFIEERANEKRKVLLPACGMHVGRVCAT